MEIKGSICGLAALYPLSQTSDLERREKVLGRQFVTGLFRFVYEPSAQGGSNTGGRGYVVLLEKNGPLLGPVGFV
jgi:hypothetical protein